MQTGEEQGDPRQLVHRQGPTTPAAHASHWSCCPGWGRQPITPVVGREKEEKSESNSNSKETERSHSSPRVQAPPPGAHNVHHQLCPDPTLGYGSRCLAAVLGLRCLRHRPERTSFALMFSINLGDVTARCNSKHSLCRLLSEASLGN